MGAEHRQFRRSPQSFSIQYRPCGALASSWQEGKSLDISATGLRLQMLFPIELGEVLELAISLPSRQAPLQVRAVVVWSREPQTGLFECGIEFRDVTHEQQVQIDELVRFLEQ